MTAEYITPPKTTIDTDFGIIYSFIEENEENVDKRSVDSFGEEWTKFNNFDSQEIVQIGNDYFDILPKNFLSTESTNVLDLGCGTGRWSKYLVDKVKNIECIDPSSAVLTAQNLLNAHKNVRITKASVNNIPFSDNSFEFVISLGVLHHIPDTQLGINKCVEKLKKGGLFLIYLYYNLDNRGTLYKVIFWSSNFIRLIVSKLPQKTKAFVCDILAVLLYQPFIILTKIAKKLPLLSMYYKKIPLSYYEDKSFNIVRNDALDRFGTPLEKRFSKSQIKNMLSEAGLEEIRFSTKEPYWHAIAKKR